MTEGRSAQWTVVYGQGVEKDIKRLGRNDEALNHLKHFMDDIGGLTDDEDPASLGYQKVGRRFKGCLVRNLTKSCRLVYKVCRERHEVRLIMVGDHKLVYGRD